MKFDSINLEKLPAPDVVETLNFEAILGEIVEDLRLRNSDIAQLFDSGIESDPVNKLLEAFAFRELGIRQRVNDAARSVMLPYAKGTDLDNLAAFYGLLRQVVQEENLQTRPPVIEILEDDTRFRLRVAVSLEAATTAGPAGSYISHSLNADPRVKDVSVESPNPGEVVVTILSQEGTGEASQELLDIVEAALTDEFVRPLTDLVTVQSAQIVTYGIQAIIHVFDGPDSQVVKDFAIANTQGYVAEQHKIDRNIALSGLYAAMHVAGVRRVELLTPTMQIITASNEAAWNTNIDITVTNG
ncbi:MAG: baseplate J/gp47 family protein [Proteobacteria bacterium]|nr:baseplate J/gp47 family protein [Pseudomonadota bacterium]